MNWIAVKDNSDLPNYDCFMTYVLREDYPNGSSVGNIANLHAYVGFLSWNYDHSYGSIIEDGEIIYLNEIAAYCVIPSPIGLQINRKETNK